MNIPISSNKILNFDKHVEYISFKFSRHPSTMTKKQQVSATSDPTLGSKSNDKTNIKWHWYQISNKTNVMTNLKSKCLLQSFHFELEDLA